MSGEHRTKSRWHGLETPLDSLPCHPVRSMYPQIGEDYEYAEQVIRETLRRVDERQQRPQK